jgi:hypothetical protein
VLSFFLISFFVTKNLFRYLLGLLATTTGRRRTRRGPDKEDDGQRGQRETARTTTTTRTMGDGEDDNDDNRDGTGQNMEDEKGIRADRDSITTMAGRTARMMTRAGTVGMARKMSLTSHGV